jgi:hypothetical protein
MERIVIAALCATVLFSVPRAAAQGLDTDDSDWRDGGTCYEIFVRSFYDSDGDGVGDLEGLIQKLDYVNDGDPEGRKDLGARCIWLMPIAASPSYHGYDDATTAPVPMKKLCMAKPVVRCSEGRLSPTKARNGSIEMLMEASMIQSMPAATQSAGEFGIAIRASEAKIAPPRK